MKILITTDWYTPSVNGVVTSVLNLQKQLETAGHEVRVLTLAQNREQNGWFQHSKREGSVWYLPSVGAGKIYPGARITLGIGRQYLKEMIWWKPDVVHSQCEFTTFWFARKIAAATNAALIHTYHTVYEDYTHYFSPNRAAGKKAAAAFSRLVLKHTDAVIVPTKKVRRLLEGYGVKKPVYTIPSGIDCRKFEEAGNTEEEQPRWDLVTVGRLAKEKNIGEILEWLAAPEGAMYTYLIVGDGPEREHLEKQARELGISDRICFAGMVKPEETPAWYQKGRIFVSASKSETQGLTYLEALAGGIPAVCRKDPCLEGVIQNGINGWQYETKEDFFRVMEFLKKPEIYQNFSKQAKEGVRTFDQSLFAKKVLDVYEEHRICTIYTEKEENVWKTYPEQKRVCG